MLDVMLEFFDTLLINDANVYFGHKDKVYLISIQLVIDVIGIYEEGYVEKTKG